MPKTWWERVGVRMHGPERAFAVLPDPAEDRAPIASTPRACTGAFRHAGSRALAHPLWSLALVVMVLNDHVLKGAGLLPAACTGKLSDLAGLFLAPALLATLVHARSRPATLLCHAIVGAVFAAINLSSAAAHAWSSAFAAAGIPWAVWSDPTDLAALPALLASWLCLFRGIPRPALPRPVLGLALVVGALACLGSSPWPVAKPTVVADRVFVEHHEGALFVLDPRSGQVRTALLSTGSNANPPAIADHILYAVDKHNRITGIDVDNPMQPFLLWQIDDRNAWVTLPLVDAHRVYAFVQGDERSLIAIDRSFGQAAWTLPIERLPREIRASGDLLLVPDERNLVAVDARTGRTVWKFRGTDDVGVPDVEGSIVYVATRDGAYSGLDLRTGALVWRFLSGKSTCSESEPIALVDQGVLVACFDGDLHGISIGKARVMWTAPGFAAAHEEGRVVAREGEDRLMGLDAQTGRKLWSVQLDDDLWTEPVVAAGTAYVRNHVGKIYAVDVIKGALRWQVDMGQKVDTRVVGNKLVVVRREP